MNQAVVYGMVVKVNDVDHFKIGWTSNLKHRLSGVQTGCPIPIQHVLVRNVPSRHAACEAEKTLHRLLAPFRVVGEWFALDTTNPEHKAAFRLATCAAFSKHDASRWNWHLLTPAEAQEWGRRTDMLREGARMLGDPSAIPWVRTAGCG